MEFDNDEAFEMTKENYCEACKGANYMDDSGCYETCEGFAEAYVEIVEQLKEEDSQ